MCGVVGIKGSPIIIAYYFLFVNKRRNKKDNDGGDGDMVMIWMGLDAPTLPIYNIPIYNAISSAYFSAHPHYFLKTYGFILPSILPIGL